MVKAKLKWQKQKLDIELDPARSVADFKASVFSLTNVPVERQKLTCPKAWKGQLTDAVDLTTCTLKDGLLIMLIGSADTMAAKTTDVKFVEDMKEEEVAAVSLPVGFRNLGNTCYMNSTLQCLRFVPELQEGLRALTHQGSQAADGYGSGAMVLGRSLNNTFTNMDKTTQPYSPQEFWQALKAAYPQFAQTSPQGFPMQQDAEEFYSSAQQSLAETLKQPHGLPDLGGASNLIDALFGVEMEQTLTCDEAPEEKPIVNKELTRKLVCNIQGGAGSHMQVDHLHEGVKVGLKGSLEKNSDVLGRNALWTRTQKIDRLPRYLCVQFMRFYWKEAKVLEEGREVIKGQKCKIMRPVSFPEVLDVYDFCSERLQSVLKMNRDRHGDEVIGDLKRPKLAAAEEQTADNAMEDEEPAASTHNEEFDDELQAALKMSMETETSQEVSTAGPGLPADFQGNYELYGLVTHKGRFADGGHYTGWVRQDGEDWLLFDDDEVTPCKTTDVLPLKGGGDSEMAYLAFYRVKN